MEFKEFTVEEKAKYLSSELVKIREAKALLERFEKLTSKWLAGLKPANGSR